MERRAEILGILRKRLERAQRRRMAAYKRFDEAVRVPSGIPHTCGALSVHQAAQEFKQALEEVQRALQEQTDFMVRDVIPWDLDRSE